MDYRLMVRQTAQDVGLDPNLAEAVLHQESRGNPSAVSPKGATGLMQLMPETAKELGVDPRDPAQNILGGVRYLKQQIDKYGVEGGLAAYNAGPGRVQKATDFNSLPAETRSYVPSVMNRAAQIAMADTNTVSDAAPSPGISDYIGALEKAKAANDDAAIKEISGALKGEFSNALSKAKAAGDTAAVEEITGAMGRYVGSPVEAPKPAPAPAPVATNAPEAPLDYKTLGKKALRVADDAVRGVADALTFGFADEIAAKMDQLTGLNTANPDKPLVRESTKLSDLVLGKSPNSYESIVAEQRKRDAEGGAARLVGQVGGGLALPGLAVTKVATGARLGRAGIGALTGAAQGGLYGAGTAEEGNRLEGAKEGAALGAITGGVLGGVLPATTAQKGSTFIKKAGSDEAARVDAEIIRDINKVAGNPNNRGNPVQAIQANSLETKYVADVKSAIKEVGKDGLKKMGTSAQEINDAIAARRILTPEELNKLRTNKAGEALADSIEKAQRIRSMTAPVPASTNIFARTGRVALDLAPIPQPVRYLGQRVLGARQTREDTIQKLISDKQAAVADEVLQRLGPSAATNSLTDLQNLAQKAQQGRQAMVAQQQAQQAAALAQQAATKNQILQQTHMPAGGGFQELMTGGRSGLNMTSGDAIDALRTVSKAAKGTPVGDAAKQMLRSQPVKDEQAFYGVQNMIRRLSEEGKIGSPTLAPAQGVLSSGIRNPVSYEANVKNATEALKLAREAAPSPELAQFASSVGRIKASAEKAKAIEERLAKATDPAEIDYLTKLVKPLANFGKK